MTFKMSHKLDGHIITVFGGTGFVGRAIIAQLVAAGARVKVATRHLPSAYFLRLLGAPGQVVPVPVSYRSEDSVDAAIVGSTMVINCLGILTESRKGGFSQVHNDFPVWMVRSCAKRGIYRFIHISALGVDHSLSRYAISKLDGEYAIKTVYPQVTILRPSIIFGADDNFFNRFACLAKILPALPLIGGGHTRFQPVYVGDVASAVLNCMIQPVTAGHIYELGGPQIITFRQLMQKMLKFTAQKRRLITLPWWVARVQAACMFWLPNPPITNDQITSLQSDSIVGNKSFGFQHLGITPTPIDEILPTYLVKEHA